MRALTLAAFTLVLVLPAAARAQGGAAGSFIGHVYDQAGQPLRGVKVTVRSPTQIGGSKVAYTDGEGFFRVPQLAPGRFELISSAPRMKTYVAKDIQVGVVSAVELNIIMEVESGNVEEVRVVEKAPVVSTTTSN